PMQTGVERHVAGEHIWIARAGADDKTQSVPHQLSYEVLESEAAVGRVMLDEIETATREKAGDLTVVIVGGRGGQALHRLLGEKAITNELDHVLSRLNVFTQDALTPMGLRNPFSFVRDFERLLGKAFFAKVKSFTSMQTDAQDLESGLINYLETLESRDRKSTRLNSSHSQTSYAVS